MNFKEFRFFYYFIVLSRIVTSHCSSLGMLRSNQYDGKCIYKNNMDISHFKIMQAMHLF